MVSDLWDVEGNPEESSLHAKGRNRGRDRGRWNDLTFDELQNVFRILVSRLTWI
jgi:hypothetical protein